MWTCIIGFLLLVFIAVPIIYLFYSWQSDQYPCPFCGETISKSARMCPFCSENLQRLDTSEKKLVTIGKSFREGADIRAKGDDEIERRFKN